MGTPVQLDSLGGRDTLYHMTTRGTTIDPADEQLDQQLRIRISTVDARAIAAAAKLENRKVSDWVRLTLRKACKK